MAKIKTTKLDTLFSEYVRKRAIARVGGCERCLTPKHDKEKEDGSTFPAWKQLQCSHFHGRAKQVVRYDEDNAAGLCAGCHMYFTSHPLEHLEWFKQQLGEEKFDMLNSRMRDMSKVDKAVIEIYLKVKLKKLEVKDD